MPRTLATTVWILLLALLDARSASGTPPLLELPRAQAERVVFLGDPLTDEEAIAFTSAVAASGHPGVLLLDVPAATRYLRAFLADFRPERVVPVGRFAEGVRDLEARLGVRVAEPLRCRHGRPVGLWKALFPKAERVVVCPAEPRPLLLQSACLAAALRAPLFVVRRTATNQEELRRWLANWGTSEVYAAGAAAKLCASLPDVRVRRLPDAVAVAVCYRRLQGKQGPIRTLVVANPADTRKGLGSMSLLAPWLAVQRRAALLLTNDQGDNTASLVQRAVQEPALQQADVLLLAADLRAIPMERRPNPAAGKDEFIEMEPLTPTGAEPFTFATGRLFHDELGLVTLLLARQRLLTAPRRSEPRRALVVSNPGAGLPLLETFSRYTTRELDNCGYQTTARFGHAVCKDELRRLLPEHDIFLWEGHHSTLIKEYGFAEWTEPLRPSLVFLQSCLALTACKVQPLIQRGAVSVIGSSTRVYSASGGAFSLSFFDALLYEQQSVGGAMRQAKNFLLAYSLLKEKRLGKSAKLAGANLRSAWAFTLWGDPTLQLPPPAEIPAPGRLRGVSHQVRGNTIVVSLPKSGYPPILSGQYLARMRPNARMAGLLSKDVVEKDSRCLVPFVFVEVHLPRARSGQTPRLRCRLPDDHWVFNWDRRRRCGYLLVTPRPQDQRELRFHIDWQPLETAEMTY